MRNTMGLVGLLALAACAQAQETGDFAATSVKENFYATKDAITKWVQPTPKLPNQPVPESYCYKAQTDILCYRQPMPGWEARLVGYQGTNAVAPAPVVTEPLPVAASDPYAQPAARLAKLTPIFVGEPPPVKTQTVTTQTTVTESSTQENAADPALTPQL